MYKDLALIDQLLQELPIAGQVVKSGLWLPMQPVPEAKPVKHLLVRAWEFKTKITLNLKGTKLSDGLKKIWVQTFEVRVDDPAHRKFFVVALRHFVTGKVAYFIMFGHSFGLVPVVFNYYLRFAPVKKIWVQTFEVRWTTQLTGSSLLSRSDIS